MQSTTAGNTKIAKFLTGLDFNLEQKVWPLAFILTLLKVLLEFFHGEMDRNRTLEGTSFNFTASTKHSGNPILLWDPLGNSFPHSTPSTPLLLVTVMILLLTMTSQYFTFS